MDTIQVGSHDHSHTLCHSEVQPEGMEMKSQNQAENGEKRTVLDKRRPPNKLLRYGQIFLAEFIGTALLIFMVCMGCMNGITKDPISPIQSPLTSGFAVGIIVQVFGHVSGAHLNPAVTACFFTLGHINIITSLVYLAAEVLGAIGGYGLLVAIIPTTIMNNNPGHCETNPHPDISNVGAAFFEFFITSLLIFLVCGLLDPRNNTKQDSSSIKFGLAVAGLSYAGAALTGASLNPARSIGPALWNGAWTSHWVYWLGPMTAGFLVPFLYQYAFQIDLTKNSDD